MSSSQNTNNGINSLINSNDINKSAKLPFQTSAPPIFKSATKSVSNPTNAYLGSSPINAYFADSNAMVKNNFSNNVSPFNNINLNTPLFPKHNDMLDPMRPLNIQPPHLRSTQSDQAPYGRQIENLEDKKQDLQEDDQEDEITDEEQIIFISSKVPKSLVSDNNCGPPIYNEYSSCTIQYEPEYVVKGVSELLTCYSNEIDYQVSNTRNEIEGIIFIRHRPISWLITIWAVTPLNSQNNVSRVEFQKRQGNCIDFQQFWSEMLEKIHERFETKNIDNAQRCGNFQQLFMPKFDLEPMECDNEQLNQFNEQLCDDYHEVAVDALGSLCTRLEEENNFAKCVSKHDELMKTLATNVLKHIDSSHVRGGLAALKMIVEASDTCIDSLLNQNKILNTIVPLLKHTKTLVRKHAVRLLAVLSKKDWCLPNEHCIQIQQQLQTLQKEWNIRGDKSNNDFVSWKMFDQIQTRVQKTSNDSSALINKLNLNVSSKK